MTQRSPASHQHLSPFVLFPGMWCPALSNLDREILVSGDQKGEMMVQTIHNEHVLSREFEGHGI